jgi:hypothetical protein
LRRRTLLLCLVAAAALLASCGERGAPVTGPGSTERSLVWAPGPRHEVSPDSHSNPERLLPYTSMSTLVLEPPRGERFSPLDRVRLSAVGEADREGNRPTWEGWARVPFHQLLFGRSVYNPEGGIECCGSPVVARVRPRRAQIWFDLPIRAGTLVVSIGRHEFELEIPERFPRARIPLRECVWVLADGRVVSCKDDLSDAETWRPPSPSLPPGTPAFPPKKRSFGAAPPTFAPPGRTP